MSTHNFSTFENLNTLFTAIGNKLRGKLEGVNLTQAQYDALTPAEKMNGKTYFITDADGGISPSAGGSGNNNYSLDEQEDGTWVDGSKIYKKTFIIPSNTSDDQTINMNVTNLDKIIKYEGGVYGAYDNYGVTIKYKNLDGYNYNNSSEVNNDNWCDVFINNGTISINLTQRYFNTKSNGYGHITVWYTKSAS